MERGNGAGTRLEERPPGQMTARRPQIPVPGGPEEVAAPRRWGLVAVGVIVALTCGLAFLSMWRSAGDREPLVVVARDVERYETIKRSDLRTALVAAEPGISSVPEQDLDDLVGRVAVTELVAGALLSPAQVAEEDQRIVDDDEALVGARLGPGAVPLGDLPVGAEILVVIRPGPASLGTDVRAVPGWLAELGERNPTNGAREASLVVPQGEAAVVAAAAAEERIAVVGLEG